MLAAFAMGSSVQAGDKAANAKANTSKTTCSATVQASCGEKTACCAKTVAAKVRHAKRGATLLARL